MPQVTIPFQEHFQEAMLDGRKQCTARTKPAGTAGDTFEAFGATFEIRAVVRHALHDVRSFLWRMEGVESPEAFVEVWEGLHRRAGFRPEQQVYVHFFTMTVAPSGPDARSVYAAPRINSLLKANGEVAYLYVHAVDEAEALLKQIQDIWDALYFAEVDMRLDRIREDGTMYTIKEAYDKLTPILPLRDDRPNVQPLLALVKWWRDEKETKSFTHEGSNMPPTAVGIPTKLLEELQASIEGASETEADDGGE